MTAIQEKHEQLRLNGIDLGNTVGAEEILADTGNRQRYQSGAIYFHPRIGTPFECHGVVSNNPIDGAESHA